MISIVVASLALAQEKPFPQPWIYSRKNWGANKVVLELKPHKITTITVHHTGVKQDKARAFFSKLRGLQAWSQREDELAGGKKKPQWADIPYHYYIDWQGGIAECRPINLPGDTNTSYDVRGHALVVVEGTFPDDEFNADQQKSLMATVLWLSDKYHVPAEKIKGHMDYAPGETDCPGTSIMEFLPKICDAIKKHKSPMG